MKTPFLILVASLLLTACKDYQIALQPDLRENAQLMTVKGRQGNMINQKVSFGEFYTDRVKRGWTVRYNIPFVVRFEGAQEKLSFTQFDAAGNKAVVSAIGKFRSAELNWLGSFFNIPLQFKNYFAGSIYLPHTERAYDFIVYNPESNFILLPTKGHLQSGDLRIDISGVTKLQDQKVWNIDNLGFEYFKGSQAVGASQIFNNGKVWLRNGLEADERLVLAALSTALMIRNNELAERMSAQPVN